MGQQDNPSFNIILIGFSFTGKSRVGREVARRLNRPFIDTDYEIVARSGKSILDIFAEEGEEGFRRRERKVLEEACSTEDAVISVGGGAVLSGENRQLMMRRGVVVCLEAKPHTILKRLQAQAERSANPVARPLLSGRDPLSRIQSLKEYRQPFYAMADWAIHTDHLTIQEAAEQVINGIEYAGRRFQRGDIDEEVFPPASVSGRESEAPYCVSGRESFIVKTSSAQYPVYVGWGILEDLGPKMRDSGLKGLAVLISDEKVLQHHGTRAIHSLERSDFEVLSIAIPSGESSKSGEQAANIYDRLVERRVERGHPVVALGGGVVSDLAGFIAATYLRGLPLVQVPTSLAAMVDASIGGKVAINHPRGKNLIGAFYQPRMVYMDVKTLATLPPRELTSGWAEVIKHAVILDPPLFDVLEREAEKLKELSEDITVDVVRRSAALKGQVVGEDEKETTGRRIILNYGHTLGHALEAATEYRELLHGEAVSIGMMAAAMLSQRLGLISEGLVLGQKALLERYGLPTSCPTMDIERIVEGMELDKKVKGKALRWVLIEGLGKTVIRDDVPSDLAHRVIKELMG